jgi:8-oxo-dGTP diphosphatase
MKSTDVVAAIIKKDNCYLITQRNKHKYFALKWEFPGGKVEPYETLQEALSREIYEELDIGITIHTKIAQEKFKDNEINIILHYFLCSINTGTITLNEHEAIAWVDKKDFSQYDFVEGDGKITSLI